jgi:alpha-1,6-mannosyltransferase
MRPEPSAHQAPLRFRPAGGSAAPPGLVDTTMLYAPQSGGVKRYLSAKADWFSQHRAAISHSQVLPGPSDRDDDHRAFVHAAPLPFGRGYRWPMNLGTWTNRIVGLRPSLIEAEDPYLPGKAALCAGQRLGVPVIGFCHSDVASLVRLRMEGRKAAAVRKLWARRFEPFDQVLAPSRYLAGILAGSGLDHVLAMPLGVDTEVFRPRAGARAALRAALGLKADERLLVFAGRAAPEKRLDVLIGAVEALGAPYRLLLVGAEARHSPRVLTLPFQADEDRLAGILAGCDALAHANPYEALGLVVIEAMACGLPVVGVAHGGVGETIDESFGERAHAATPAALAEAITALFERDLPVLGARARARAVEQYRWDAAFERLTALYCRMTGSDAFLGVRDRGMGHEDPAPARPC